MPHDPPCPALERLCHAIARKWPPHRFAEVTTTVAVSGGADSVALLRALVRLRPTDARGRLIVLHYNHRLRGEHSERDARFVAELAGSLDLECEIGHAAAARSLRTQHVAEATLRDQRYAFFDAAAHRRGARYVVTAHTADDNVETILHNLFRGTGPAGAAGMPRFRELGRDVVLVRPLLETRREELRRALREIGQEWREDASNRDPRWQRNWIRGVLLPEIRTRYPDADEALSRLARQQTETLDWLRHAAVQWADKHLRSSPGGPLEIVADGQQTPRAVIVAALRQAWDVCGWPRGAMAERHWNALARLIATEAPPTHQRTVNLPGALRAAVTDCGSVVVAAIAGD